ncbi:hypothetical protein ACQJBY_064252 [Aegilops geniculata]
MLGPFELVLLPLLALLFPSPAPASAASLCPLAATSNASSHTYARPASHLLRRCRRQVWLGHQRRGPGLATRRRARARRRRATLRVPRPREGRRGRAGAGQPTGPSIGAAPTPPRWRRWSGPTGSTSSPAMTPWRSAPGSRT